MYKKQNDLAMLNENCTKIYIIEIKIVMLFSMAKVKKKREK